jgi:hypothetical protein
MSLVSGWLRGGVHAVLRDFVEAARRRLNRGAVKVI